MNKANITNSLNNVDVLILCGGKGMRFRPVVSDRPKVMAEVHGKPFLEIIFDELLKQGLRRIIFCTGYLGDQIESYFKSRSYAEGVTLEFSREEKPLGTGGAVKNAFKFIKSDNFFVMNGDTFPRLNFNDFYTSHLRKQLPLSIALVERRYSNGQGNVQLAKEDIINSFVENYKEDSAGFASVGCYVMRGDVKEFFPGQDSFSLEYDVFPKLAGESYGFVFDGKFLDIGTPERYASAGDFFS